MSPLQPFKHSATLLLLLVGLLTSSLALPALAANFKFTLLVAADDQRLARARLERGVLGHPGGPVADALKVALAEHQMEFDAAKARLDLEVVEVADATPLPLLNLGAGADMLRQADCRRNLFHLALSERMRTDALAQALVARRWSKVLLLTGPSAEDAARSEAAQASIKRYGLKLVANKPFKLSADPRERDLANTRLLTSTAGSGDYDAVWVVDSDGEFAVSVPYRTALPRPVVGDAGLVAVAWSPKFERFGAPQVTRRLSKAVGRPMGAYDWPAWLAGKALATAVLAAPKGPLPPLHKALAEGGLDGSKGVVMSFRPWDGQLRQPVLLSDGLSVVDMAPGEGVLHPKNNLDTLGADAPEKLCKARG